jgi:hypothetical protein
MIMKPQNEEAQAAAIDTLALMSFVANEDPVATARIMELFKGIFESPNANLILEAGMPTYYRANSSFLALKGWCLLATTTSKRQIYDFVIPQ